MSRAVPLVSVLMPHHGCEPFLYEAAASILSQDHQDLELLVVDDASACQRWLRELEKLAGDPRLRVFRTDRRVGPYRIKNRLMAQTSSPFIAFQDADDRSHRRRLSCQLELLHRRRIDMIGTAFNLIDEGGRRLGRRRMPRYVNLWHWLGKSFLCHQPTTMMRREVLDLLIGFDGTTCFGADTELILRAGHCCTVRNLPEYLYDYRQRSGSLTHDPATGHGSPARDAYISKIRLQERARRRTWRRQKLLEMVRPTTDDVDFDIQAVSMS